MKRWTKGSTSPAPLATAVVGQISAASRAMSTGATARPRVIPRSPVGARALSSARGEGGEAIPSRQHGTLIISRSFGSLTRSLPAHRLEAWMNDFAVTGHQRALDELILPIHLQGLLLLVDHGLEEGEQVFGVEARCIDGNLSGEIERSGDRHALVRYDLVGLGELAIAAPFGGEVDNHRARLHAFHHRRRDE